MTDIRSISFTTISTNPNTLNRQNERNASAQHYGRSGVFKDCPMWSRTHTYSPHTVTWFNATRNEKFPKENNKKAAKYRVRRAEEQVRVALALAFSVCLLPLLLHHLTYTCTPMYTQTPSAQPTLPYKYRPSSLSSAASFARERRAGTSRTPTSRNPGRRRTSTFTPLGVFR